MGEPYSYGPRLSGQLTAQCRVVLREDKACAFRSAAGVLNAVHSTEVKRVSARPFEAAGCGAAALAEFR